MKQSENGEHLHFNIDFEECQVSQDKEGKFNLQKLVEIFQDTLKQLKTLQNEQQMVKQSKWNCLAWIAVQSPKLQNGRLSRKNSFYSEQQLQSSCSPIRKKPSFGSTQTTMQQSLLFRTQSSFQDVSERCQFCQIDAVEIIQLPCQHKFHQSCLMKLSIEFLHSDDANLLCPCGAPINLELFDSLDPTKVHTQELKFHQISNQLKQIWIDKKEILKCENEGCTFYFSLSKDDENLESYCPLCLNQTKGVRP